MMLMVRSSPDGCSVEVPLLLMMARMARMAFADLCALCVCRLFLLHANKKGIASALMVLFLPLFIFQDLFCGKNKKLD